MMIAEPAHDLSGAELTQARMKVLLVDDDPSVLTALTRLLRPDGVQLLTAGNGVEALQLLERDASAVAVVMSDYSMPGMNGAELLRSVRLRWPDLTRILLTGNADLAAAARAINEGEVSRLYMKPWQPEQLRHALAQAVEQHRMVEENRRLRALADEQSARLEHWNARLEALVAERTAELETANTGLHRGLLATVRLLLTFMEWRFPERAARAREIARLAGQLANGVGLPASEVRQVQVAGLIHDVGLLRLSDELVCRPVSTLSVAARAQYKRHPLIGHALLTSVEQLSDIALWVRHHHERWDGKGYPDQLAGPAIPVAARILALASGYLEAVEREGRTALLWRQDQRHAGAYDPDLLTLLGDLVTRRPEAVQAEPAVVVPLAQLAPGMILREPIETLKGLVLVPAGEHLTARHVEKIHQLIADGALTGTESVALQQET